MAIGDDAASVKDKTMFNSMGRVDMVIGRETEERLFIAWMVDQDPIGLNLEIDRKWPRKWIPGVHVGYLLRDNTLSLTDSQFSSVQELSAER